MALPDNPQQIDYAMLPIIIEANSDALKTFADGVATAVGFDAANAVRHFGESVLLSPGQNQLIAVNSADGIETLIPTLNYGEVVGHLLGKYPTIDQTIARRDSDGAHCLVMTESSSSTRAVIVFNRSQDGDVAIQHERVSSFDPQGRRTSSLTAARRALRSHPTPSQ